jgi:hypothetical protein
MARLEQLPRRAISFPEQGEMAQLKFHRGGPGVSRSDRAKSQGGRLILILLVNVRR